MMTHKMVIEIPLDVDAQLVVDYDAVQETLRVVMQCSRMMHDGVICGDVSVSLVDV